MLSSALEPRRNIFSVLVAEPHKCGYYERNAVTQNNVFALDFSRLSVQGGTAVFLTRSIRRKLVFGLALVLVMLTVMSFSGLWGLASLRAIIQDESLDAATASEVVASVVRIRAVIPAAGLNRFPLTTGTFELDVDAFAESAIQWQSDTAIVVTPNNPTALSVSREDILRLARRLQTHNCRLIVDESFIEFARTGAAGSVEDAIEDHPNLVVIKSLSKVFGIAGLRIGYLLSADRELIDAVRSALPIWNINGLAEEFLRTVGRYRAEFAASCELTRFAAVQLYEDLCALPGIAPIEPDANFILARLTDPLASAPEVARRLYIEHNILIKDCAAKSMPDAARYLRIASRTPVENSVLITAISAVLQLPYLTPEQPIPSTPARSLADVTRSRTDDYRSPVRVQTGSASD